MKLAKITKLFLITLFLCIFLVGCSDFDENGYQEIFNPEYTSNQDENATVKNIILLIGDGMGANQVEVAKYYLNGAKLDLDSYEYKGLINTSCLDNEVTDSAAAATAMATGNKTVYQRLGMDKEGNDCENILEYASSKGYKTGIITDEVLYDATPAAFSCHVRNRYTYKNDILKQQCASIVDVLIGYGDQDYITKKTDVEKTGFTYINNKKDFLKTKVQKLFACFPEGEQYQDNVPTLYEMTNKALQILSNDKGFVLMVECGRIDGACHNGDISSLVDSVYMLDKTLRVILNYMRQNDNTLVIVLADHETGGLEIASGEPNSLWFTNETSNTEGKYYHTAVPVPVYAFGNKSNIFDNCNIENTEIFNIIKNEIK